MRSISSISDGSGLERNIFESDVMSKMWRVHGESVWFVLGGIATKYSIFALRSSSNKDSTSLRQTLDKSSLHDLVSVGT